MSSSSAHGRRGVRHVLVLGPEGSGKSTWMRALAEQGRGVLGLPEALDRAPLEAALLVEDVDRLPPAEQASRWAPSWPVIPSAPC